METDFSCEKVHFQDSKRLLTIPYGSFEKTLASSVNIFHSQKLRFVHGITILFKLKYQIVSNLLFSKVTFCMRNNYSIHIKVSNCVKLLVPHDHNSWHNNNWLMLRTYHSKNIKKCHFSQKQSTLISQ